MKQKRIKDMFAQGRHIFSFEFFPPKTDAGRDSLYVALGELKKLNPDFVSVTYGALGSSQDKSLALIHHITETIALPVMAHYTCIGATEEKVQAFLDALDTVGVCNIMALRGDAPQGMDLGDALARSPFTHAIDLVRFIKRLKGDAVSLGVAGYPEGHPECPDKNADLGHLKAKVDAGADFVVTQLFFDNQDFFRFCDRVRRVGITVPIIPGIMPVEQYKQIERITAMGPTNIPAQLKSIFERTDLADTDKRARAIEYTTQQCRELLARGVNGLHLYTMNKSTAARDIFRALQR